jgi:hypothetical protein
MLSALAMGPKVPANRGNAVIANHSRLGTHLVNQEYLDVEHYLPERFFGLDQAVLVCPPRGPEVAFEVTDAPTWTSFSFHLEKIFFYNYFGELSKNSWKMCVVVSRW